MQNGLGWFLKIFLCALLLCNEAVLANTIAQAQKAIDNAEYSTAVIHLKNHLKANPKDAQGRFLLGDVYLRTGKLEAALKELGRANDNAPDNSDYLLHYARVLQATNKSREVLKHLGESFSDTAQDAQRLALMGFAHVSLNQLADAKEHFNQSLSQQPTSEAYNGLASLALSEKDDSQVQEYLAKSLALSPDNLKALQLKAYLANTAGEPEQALILYSHLIKQYPNNLLLYLDRANTLAKLKQWDKAKKDIEHILAKNKQLPQANAFLAGILLQEKDYVGAQDAAQLAVNVMPKHLPATFILGASNFALQQFNQAEEYLTIYLANVPDDLNAQNILANVYLAQNKAQQAILVIEGIPEVKHQQDAKLLLTLGQAYLMTGKTQQSLAALTKAQTLEPDNTDIQKHLIAAKFQAGQLKEAMSSLEAFTQTSSESQPQLLLISNYLKHKQFDKAQGKITELLKKSSKDSQLLTLQALVYQLTGDLDKAKAQFGGVIQQDKRYIPAYLGLGRLAAIQENWGEAEKQFKAALAINPKTIQGYLGLVALMDKQNKPKQVEAYFQQAIENTQDILTTQLQLARLQANWYQQKQQPEKVLILAQQLNRQHTDKLPVKAFLASAQQLNGQTDKAEQTLKSILHQNKKANQYRLMLAQLLLSQATRTEEGLVLLREAQLMAPDTLEPYVLEVGVYIKDRQFNKALEVTKTMQQKMTDSLPGQQLEADIYRDQKAYSKAIPLYQTVYQQKPSPKIAQALVESWLATGQRTQAVSFLNQAIKDNPKDIDSTFQLASLYHETQQLTKAKTLYEQILTDNTQHLATLNNLAWLYLESDITKALKLAKQAYDAVPQSADIADTYGYFLLKNNQIKKGLTLLEQARKQNPDNLDIQYHLALAYEKSGQRNKAKDLLKPLINSSQQFAEKIKAQQLWQQIK